MNEFTLLKTMPTSRLNDILKSLETKPISVLNLDACLPSKEAGEPVLFTILHKIPATLKCLSLRFNNLTIASCEMVIEFILKNNFIEILYVMGCGFEDKLRIRLEESWKKNLVGHRTENGGYTFMRVTLEQKILQEKSEIENNEN
jgi:hypothetical protein